MRYSSRWIRLALLGVLACGSVSVRAQATQPAAPAQFALGPVARVTLAAWRSFVLPTEFDITRVAITNPNIADATVVSPREILIDGKATGTVSLIVWGQDQRTQYEVVVDPGVSPLQRQLQTLFPGEDIKANETAEAIILTGHASDQNVMLRAAEITEAISPKARVINMLQLPGGIGSQQVLLQVRVAEVNRRALTELGASYFTGGVGVKDVLGRVTTQQFAAPSFTGLSARYDLDGNLLSSEGQLTFSDFVNIFLFSNQEKVGLLIRALQTTGNFQSLAEPNLIAYNGQEASFLAGGELPIPVSQGLSGQVAITYKEFGVRLNFRPTIGGDVIRLKVRPEVSSLDFANGISIGGIRIPSLIVRRAETDIELRDGQSFAIAGLMNNASQETRQGIPILSAVPIIGNLFKSRATNRDRTELLILVTPHLVKALNPDEVPPVPTVPDKFLPPCEKPPCEGSVPPKKGTG
ncbi:MAG: type II and III secretion system protein family protein, partial [Vicinamibacterales bacterium]